MVKPYLYFIDYAALIYRFSGTDVYRDNEIVGQISFQSNGIRLQQVVYTGKVSFILERERSGYRINENGAEAGTVSRGLRINYNFQEYKGRMLRRGSVEGSPGDIVLENAGMPVATIKREGMEMTVDCTTAESEIPAFVVAGLLSQYRFASQGAVGNRTSRQAMIPKNYMIASGVLSALAFFFIYTSYLNVFGLGPYSIYLFGACLLGSVIIRVIGRRRLTN